MMGMLATIGIEPGKPFKVCAAFRDLTILFGPITCVTNFTAVLILIMNERKHCRF